MLYNRSIHVKIIYVIETNFYGGGGSKLNETARSYLGGETSKDETLYQRYRKLTKLILSK